MEITVKVIGNPIVCGLDDTFIAATMGDKSVTKEKVPVGDWEFCYQEKASVSDGVVTLFNAGHYKLTILCDTHYIASITTPKVYAVLTAYCNSAVIGTATAQVNTKTITFSANAGDTVRVRGFASAVNPATTPDPTKAFYYAMLLEKVPNEVSE